MITSLNQSTYSSTNNCSNRYQLPNHDLASLLHVKQNYIYCKYTIRSAFPLEQHANPFTIYLRIFGLSINQHTVQLTIIHRNINYQTMILQDSYNSSNIISYANTQLVQYFHSNSMQILIQYISAHD